MRRGVGATAKPPKIRASIDDEIVEKSFFYKLKVLKKLLLKAKILHL